MKCHDAIPVAIMIPHISGEIEQVFSKSQVLEPLTVNKVACWTVVDERQLSIRPMLCPPLCNVATRFKPRICSRRLRGGS
jgi:hypothetical protein